MVLLSILIMVCVPPPLRSLRSLLAPLALRLTILLSNYLLYNRWEDWYPGVNDTKKALDRRIKEWCTDHGRLQHFMKEGEQQDEIVPLETIDARESHMSAKTRFILKLKK